MQESSLLSCWPAAFGSGLNRLRMPVGGHGFQLNWILPFRCPCYMVLFDLGQVAEILLDMVSLFVQRRITFTLLRVAFVICLVVLVFTSDQCLLQLFSSVWGWKRLI